MSLNFKEGRLYLLSENIQNVEIRQKDDCRQVFQCHLEDYLKSPPQGSCRGNVLSSGVLFATDGLLTL